MRGLGGMRWSRGNLRVAGLEKAGWWIGEVLWSGVAFVVEACWVGGDVGSEALRYAASDGRQQ